MESVVEASSHEISSLILYWSYAEEQKFKCCGVRVSVNLTPVNEDHSIMVYSQWNEITTVIHPSPK